VLECRRCHYYYCSPFVAFSREDFEILYDNEYFGQPTEQYADRQRVSVPTRNLQRLESLCTRDIHDFLEIGFGEGYVLKAAQLKGWRPVGVEVTPAYAESVSKRLGVPVLLGQFQELSLPEESFDIIYVNSVLEHVTDPEGFLRECRRVLRPGGMAFFVVPNEDALINDFRHIIYRLMGRNTASRLDPFRNPYHIQGFSPHSLRLLFELTNLKIVSFDINSGTNELRKYKLGSWKKLAFKLALYPVYWLGERTGRGTSLVAVVT
jgi:SAM-dependent methyltransferase